MAKKKTASKKSTSKKTTKKVNKTIKKTIATKPQVEDIKIATDAKSTKVTSVQNAAPQSAPTWFDKPENKRKINGLIMSAIAIGLFAGFTLYVIPDVILTQTDDKVQEREEREREEERERIIQEAEIRLNNEASVLNFEENKNWEINMQVAEFGDLKINLREEFAPKTVENFVRLAYRGYYDNTRIHRMVEDTDFAVIQGGDRENGDGTGGNSAFYIEDQEEGLIEDEIWLTRPEFTVETRTTETGAETQENVLANEPVLRYPDLYANFDADSGTIEYRKGLILMAKTSMPDSASSQFFITLDKTVLPAEYTVFGVIDEESFATLDKITAEVDPSQNDAEGNPIPGARDGVPSKEINIEKVEIISPEVF